MLDKTITDLANLFRDFLQEIVYEPREQVKIAIADILDHIQQVWAFTSRNTLPPDTTYAVMRDSKRLKLVNSPIIGVMDSGGSPYNATDTNMMALFG